MAVAATGTWEDAVADEILAAPADVVIDERLVAEALPPRPLPVTPVPPVATNPGSSSSSTGTPALDLIRRNVIDTCNRFVETFLLQGSSISSLHTHLLECDETLASMQQSLEKYLRRIELVCRDIGILQSKAAETELVLLNTLACEATISHALSFLLIPPELIRVLLTASDLELGPQFTHETRRLLAMILARQGGKLTVRRPIAAATTAAAGNATQGLGGTVLSSSVVGHATPPGHPLQPQPSTTAWSPAPSSAASHGGSFGAGTTPPTGASSSGTTLHDSSNSSGGGSEFVTIDLAHFELYTESTAIIRKLTDFTCYKIRTFLLAKIDTVLGKPRTNVAVQQHNVLRQYRPLVRFLRQASEAFEAGQPNSANHCYNEVRAHYVQLMARIYRNNMRTYILSCNALEMSWSSSSSSAPSAPTAAPNAGPDAQNRRAAEGVDSSAGASTRGSNNNLVHSSSGSGFAYLFGGPTKTATVAQPLLTNRSNNVRGSDFSAGVRISVLDRFRATPVIPLISRQQQRMHSYEETFRSLNVLLSDVVTSEFLFSFEFFDGDTSVYVGVFRDTVQCIVDYVSSVVLKDSIVGGGSSKGGNRTPKSIEMFEGCRAAAVVTDYCGLMILIRLVRMFQAEMHRRKLYCLDGYYDSLLLLLWPAFEAAFDVQIKALTQCAVKDAMQFLSLRRSMREQIAEIHPIAARYAQLSSTLMTIGGKQQNEVDALALLRAAPPAESLAPPLAAEATVGRRATPNALPAKEGTKSSKRGINVATLHGEYEPDVGDMKLHVDVLAANLSLLRVEFLRLMSETADAVAQAAFQRLVKPKLQVAPTSATAGSGIGAIPGAVVLEGSVPATTREKFFYHAFFFNNCFHVLNAWCGAYRPANVLPLETSPEGGGRDRGSPGTPDSNVTPMGDNESANWLPGAVVDSSGGLLSDTTAFHVPSELDHATADVLAVHAACQAARSAFAEEVIEAAFPGLVAMITALEQKYFAARGLTHAGPSPSSVLEAATAQGKNSSSVPQWDPADVTALQAFGRHLVATAKDGVPLAWGLVASYVADAANAADVGWHVFMQLLIYNTRYHALVGAALGGGGETRGLILSNQLMLGQMKRAGAPMHRSSSESRPAAGASDET